MAIPSWNALHPVSNWEAKSLRVKLVATPVHCRIFAIMFCKCVCFYFDSLCSLSINGLDGNVLWCTVWLGRRTNTKYGRLPGLVRGRWRYSWQFKRGIWNSSFRHDVICADSAQRRPNWSSFEPNDLKSEGKLSDDLHSLNEITSNKNHDYEAVKTVRGRMWEISVWNYSQVRALEPAKPASNCCSSRLNYQPDSVPGCKMSVRDSAAARKKV